MIFSTDDFGNLALIEVKASALGSRVVKMQGELCGYVIICLGLA